MTVARLARWAVHCLWLCRGYRLGGARCRNCPALKPRGHELVAIGRRAA